MDDLGGDLRGAKVAELPQLLGYPGVLEERLVYAEGIQLAAPESVYRRAYSLHQRGQLVPVVRR